MKRKSLLLLFMLALGLPWAAWAQQTPKTLPYEYGFENNDLADEGWARNSMSSNTNINSNAKRTGNYGFRFYYNADPQYLITPELLSTSSGVTVEFYYKTSSTYFQRTFQVGYSTTTTGVSAFTFGDEITASDADWALFSQDFPAGTKYVAIKHENTTYGNLYLDDFSFEECSEYPAPKNLVLTGYTSNTATLDWMARSGQDHWDIYYSTSATAPTSSTTPQVSNTETKPYTLTGLTAGETYYAFVRGNYNNGEHYSDWSSACTFEVGCFTPTIAESMATCNQAYFSWMPVGQETSWQVAFSDQQGFDPDNVTPETVTMQYYVKENLTTGVTYYAHVRAVCGAGDYSDWSEEVSMTTECFAPSNLRATSVSPSTATLEWQQGSNESQWQISYSTTEGFTPESGTVVPVNSNPYTLTGLTLNTQYYAYVRAVCGENIYSDWSNICAFMPKYELTVGNGSNYNPYIPICASAINYTTKSQFIVPAADLADLLYANISKVSFYATSETGNMGTATFDVLIGELDGVTAFENYEFFDWSEMTSVYSGSLSVSGSKMEITLVAPYQYMGGDLLIGFAETSSGSTSGYFGWYGAETTSYCAYGGYEMTAYGYTDYSRYSFIPKTTFSYTPGTAPTCLKPTALSISQGSGTATLTWTAGDSETNWNVQYKTVAAADWSASIPVENTPTCTLSSLSPMTTYQVRVQADCGSGDVSGWTLGGFTTPCGPTNVPYTHDFDSDATGSSAAFPQCWTKLNDAEDPDYAGYPYVMGSNAHSGSNCLFFLRLYTSTALNQIAVLPEMNADIRTLRLSFYARLGSSTNEPLSVGVMTDPEDASTFVKIEDVTIASNEYAEYTVSFDAYEGSGRYIALKCERANVYNQIYVDDIAVTVNNVCFAPVNPQVSNITSHTAVLTWTPASDVTNWQIQYKKTTDTDWSESIAVSGTPSYTFSNLDAATEYQVRVRSACGGDDYSVWKTVEFTTECGAEVPYSYNFDSDAAGSSAAFPSCWTRYNDSQNSSNNYYPYVYSNNSHSSPNSLFFRTFTTDDSPNVQMAIMPEVNVDVNTLTLTFWVASNLASTLKIGVMDDPQDITTYTDVATVNIVSNTLSNPKKYTVNLSSYQGTGRYVALRREKGSANISFFVDDITLKQNTPEPIPFTCNFDNDATGSNAGAPDGWTFIGNNYPQVYVGNAHSAPNDLCLYHQNDNVQQLAVLPEMDLTTYTLQELQIVFWARVGNSTSMRNLLVGVMTDPNDVSTFTTVETVSPGTEYNEFTVSFENYSGTGKYIAIRDFSYNSSNTSFYIDDITVEPIPSCKKPGRPYVDTYTIQAHQAFVSWNKGSENQSLWQFALGTDENFDPDEVTPIDVDVTNEELFDDYDTGCSYYLTGLSAATTYYIYVRANCGTAENPDYSDWNALPRSFTTIGCDVPTQLSMLDYTTTTAWLSWNTGSGLEDDYTLAYSENEYFDPDDSEQCEYVAGITETGYTLEGLTAETTYYARVRSNCGADGYSDWSDQLEFMPSAIHSMTVYDQWKIQNRAPLPLDYVDYDPDQDQQPMIGQYVLPEIELLDMRFSRIHNLSLFTAGTIDLNSNALFNVYLKEVDEPTMSGFISFDAMTQVYTGVISIIDGVMTIVFDDPFYYTEGSLMIGFKQLTPGDEIDDAGAWRGIDPHVAACYTNDYWQGTETPSFLPTTRFTYEPYDVPSCAWPIMLKALPMATFAKLSWSYGSGECDVRYKKVSDAEWTLVEGVSFSFYEPYILRNLSPSTNYVYQVRKVCGENEYSDWSKPCYFTTHSDQPITIDADHQYVEDFDGAVFPPTDWVTESDSYVSFWHDRETTHEHYLVANSGSYNNAAMYTPELHIDAQGAVLYLKHMHNSSYNGTATYCDIKVSTDHGEHFDNLWGGMDATRVGDWIETRVSLDYYVGQDIVLKFYHFTHPEVSHSWDINEIKIKAFNKVFNGDEGSGDWSDPDMWSSDNGELPTLDDAVLVNSSVTIPEGTVAHAGQIYLNDVENNTEIQGAISIEDGGQLQVNDTVTVTMQTDVNGYGRGVSGWYLIAPPVQQSMAPSNHNVNGVLVGSYDLYAFDGSYEGAEWRNYKQHQNEFVFQNGHGYLVANSINVSPSFNGTVLPSNQTKTVELDYASTVLGGWNLVGNPFTCDAYLADNRSFLRMNGDGSKLVSASGLIHPMEGVFVEADGLEQSVTFTTTDPSQGRSMEFALSQNRSAVIDNAVLRFDNSHPLGKFMFNEADSKLYFPQNGKDYAVLSAEPVGEMPLHFEPMEDGTYTINVSTDNVDVNYLHLIDNLTGNDVDLLQMPSYTFEAHRSDYASRFKVVFATGDMGQGDDFAFVSDGNIIINGTGTVQVIDMMGRVLICSDASNTSAISTTGMASGVYVLRLIDGEHVRSQKIVVD